jgi:hypothetical protein
MGLLDSDAEELKNNSKPSSTGTSSGRKVNQSGLGAFKGLSKYNNLTAKYRKNSSEHDEKADSTATQIQAQAIGQQRGIESLITAASSPPPAISVLESQCKVSAKSVQSQCEGLLTEPGFDKVSVSSLLDLISTSKPVQSQCKVSAELIEPIIDTAVNVPLPTSPPPPLSPVEVSAKSVQDQMSLESDLSCPSHGGEHQSNYTGYEVSAKPVQLEYKADAKPVQSQCEVSAETFVDLTNIPILNATDEVSAKSVQNQSIEIDKSSPKTRLTKDVSANPEVSAKSVRLKSALSRYLGKLQIHPGAETSPIASITQSPDFSGNSTPEELPFQPASDFNPNDQNTPESPIPRIQKNSLQSSATSHSQAPTSSTDNLDLSQQSPSDTTKNHGAKSVRSQCKEDPEVGLNSVQSQSKASATHSGSQNPRSASQCEVSSQVRAPVGAKLVRSQCKLDPIESITALAGAQRIVVEFLFDRCLWNNSLVTPPITKQQLLEGTQLGEDTAISAVKRLRKKLIIDRYAYKDGQAGWTQYLLADDSYRELLYLHQVSAKSVQSQSKVSSKVSSEVSARPPSSSSSLDFSNFSKTTTEQPSVALDNPSRNLPEDLPLDWQNIYCLELNELGIPFGRTQLLQLLSLGKLSPAEVQASLNHFSFAKRHNKLGHVKSGELNFLMGILRKPGIYVCDGYISPYTNALETLAKQQEQERARRKEAETQLFEVNAEAWLSTLSLDSQKEIANNRGCQFRLGSPGFIAEMRDYYREEFWPGLWLKIQQKLATDINTTGVHEIRATVETQNGVSPEASV